MKINGAINQCQRQWGSAGIILLLVLLIIVGTMMQVVLEMSANTATDVYLASAGHQALYLAESGLEAVHYRLRHGEQCHHLLAKENLVHRLGDGSFQLIAATPFSSTCKVIIQGEFNQTVRYIQASFTTVNAINPIQSIKLIGWQEISR